MGEWDILSILKKKRKFQTATQLAKSTKLSLASIHKSLKSMRKHNRVQYKSVRKPCGKAKFLRDVIIYKLRGKKT